MNLISTFLRRVAPVALLVASAIPAMAQYDRTVLIEEFTSSTCEPCVQASTVLNQVTAEKNGRVVTIRYHMNIPYVGDPYYAENPAENDERKTDYGFAGIPYAAVDGEFAVNPRIKNEVTNRVNPRLTESAPVLITVTQTPDGTTPGRMNVAVTVATAGQAISGYRLRVNAVEALIHNPAATQIPRSNGEIEFFDVMRKRLTSRDGMTISLDKNQTRTYEFNYMVGEGWHADQMFTVAFLQDAFEPFSVIQAGYSPRPVSSVETPEMFAGYSLGESRPNPAVDGTSVTYSLGAPQNVTLALYNLSGELIGRYDQGMRPSGSHEGRIEFGALPAGTYTLAIEAGAYRSSTRVNVVR